MRKEIKPMNVWSSFNMKQIEQMLSLIWQQQLSWI